MSGGRRPARSESVATAPAVGPGGPNAEAKALQKLWLILAAIGLVMSFNVLGATQGGDVAFSMKTVLGIDLEKDVPEAVAGLWGIICLSLLIVAASAVSVAHARTSATGGWAVRYPFRVFDLPPDRGIGRAAQAIAILVLTLLPAYVLVHSWDVMFGHGVMCREERPADWRPLPARGLGLFLAVQAVPVRLTSSGDVRENQEAALPPGDRCDNAALTDYWPPVETFGLGLLSLAAAAGTVWAVLMLFITRRNHSS